MSVPPSQVAAAQSSLDVILELPCMDSVAKMFWRSVSYKGTRKYTDGEQEEHDQDREQLPNQVLVDAQRNDQPSGSSLAQLSPVLSSSNQQEQVHPKASKKSEDLD